MPTAEVITIGTELLLGEIVDTNARFLARRLRDAGIDLYRMTTVGDEPPELVEVLPWSETPTLGLSSSEERMLRSQ